MNAVDNPSTAGDKNLIRQARTIVHDLFQVKPRIYWIDYITSATIAYTAGAIYVNGSWTSPWSWVGFIIAVPLLYRISM